MKKNLKRIQNDHRQKNKISNQNKQRKLTFKFVLVGSKENRDNFLKECLTPQQFTNRKVGDDFFTITIAKNIQVEIWDMISAGLSSSHSRDYYLKNSDAIIFIEAETDKKFIIQAKKYIAKYENINQQTFFYYTSEKLGQTPITFLSEVYSIHNPTFTQKFIQKLSIFFKKEDLKNDGIELTEMNRNMLVPL